MNDSTKTSGATLNGHNTDIGNSITRWDGLLLTVLVLLTGLSLYFARMATTRSNYIWISASGKPLGFYPLDQSRVIKAKGPLGTTVIKISHGEARIVEAPCPHKLCQKMGPIPTHGRVMICIPNQIIVEMRKKKEPKTDAISR